MLRRARHIVAAGGYPAAEAEHAAGRALPITVVPPGVDTERFRPLTDGRARRRPAPTSASPTTPSWWSSISRLVPRKGFDTAIRAAALLQSVAAEPACWPSPAAAATRTGCAGWPTSARTRRCGSSAGSSNDDLPRLYGCADVYAMLCRNRWGGLEQEGFGIVFLEAAACGVPQVAGDSGGAAEAVDDGVTGLVVRHPDDPREVAAAFERLLDDPQLRARAWALPGASGPCASSPTTCWPTAWVPRWARWQNDADDIPDLVRGQPRRHGGVRAWRLAIAVPLRGRAARRRCSSAVVSLVLFAVGIATSLWAYTTALERSRSRGGGCRQPVPAHRCAPRRRR